MKEDGVKNRECVTIVGRDRGCDGAESGACGRAQSQSIVIKERAMRVTNKGGLRRAK